MLFLRAFFGGVPRTTDCEALSYGCRAFYGTLLGGLGVPRLRFGSIKIPVVRGQHRDSASFLRQITPKIVKVSFTLYFLHQRTNQRFISRR